MKLREGVLEHFEGDWQDFERVLGDLYQDLKTKAVTEEIVRRPGRQFGRPALGMG